MAYAKDTSVPVDRSKAEIERILIRYGADGFMYGWEGNSAMILFRVRGKMLRFVLPNNQTVAQFMIPQVEQAYLTGKIPDLLPQIPANVS